ASRPELPGGVAVGAVAAARRARRGRGRARGRRRGRAGRFGRRWGRGRGFARFGRPAFAGRRQGLGGRRARFPFRPLFFAARLRLRFFLLPLRRRLAFGLRRFPRLWLRFDFARRRDVVFGERGRRLGLVVGELPRAVVVRHLRRGFRGVMGGMVDQRCRDHPGGDAGGA